MKNRIEIGDVVKDVCGDVGEVFDIEYDDNDNVWRYILAEYDNSGIHTWSAHPDYTYRVN